MIPIIDLETQHRELEEEILQTFKKVLWSSKFILGPAVTDFERAMAGRHEVRHAVGVASGTDALQLGLLAADLL